MARCATVRLRRGWCSKVEILKRLARNPVARAQAPASRASRAETSRDRTAAGYSSWIQPASRACSGNRAADSLMRRAFIARACVSIAPAVSLAPVARGPPVLNKCRGTVVVGRVAQDAQAHPVPFALLDRWAQLHGFGAQNICDGRDVWGVAVDRSAAPAG